MTLSVSGKNIKALYRTIELNALSNWCSNSSLKINPMKSPYMLFSRKQSTKHQTKSAIPINSRVITKVDKVKFLGIIIDENLSWKEHTKLISLKLGKWLFALKRLKPHAPTNTLLKVYHALIRSHLNYRNILWGNAFNKYVNPISTLQKKGNQSYSQVQVQCTHTTTIHQT